MRIRYILSVAYPALQFFPRYLINGTNFVKDVKNQSNYRPEVPRGFQEIKVPRLRDSGPERW